MKRKFILLIMLILCGWSINAQVMVKDIWTGSNSSVLSFFTNVNGTLYFVAGDSTNGNELWKSDGTTTGTVMVQDINPGTGSSMSSVNLSLTNVNGILYFQADNGTNGIELWKSDGTAAGTVMVKDINSGLNGSNPSYLTNVNGVLYFSATDGTNANGQELWKSDGTATGTVMVKDIFPGVDSYFSAANSSSPSWLTNVNGTLYFSATDYTHGAELWKSDGTATGTVMVKDIYTSKVGSSPSYLTNINGTLYFSANDGTNGRELWKSDGTTTGTIMVKDINLGSDTSYPAYLTNVNGTLFFNATDGTNGGELWKSDGTAVGTVMVKDIKSGSGSSSPAALTNINGILYFQADNGTHGRELWKSAGTSAGTVMVKDINPGPGNSSSSYFFTSVNSTNYFRANDGINGVELWKSDGTATGTVMVKNIYPGSSSSNPAYLINVNGILLFSANNGTNGVELWKYVPCSITATITASGTTTFCTGDSVTLTANAATSYLWSNGAITKSIVVKTTEKDSVTVIDVNGCSGVSVATTVTVNQLPTATITASSSTTFCSGDSLKLTASTGTSYLWSNSVTTSFIYAKTAGSYTVKVTDANGCSATSTATTIKVNALPTATITPNSSIILCSGDSVKLTASSGTSYLWSNGAITSAITAKTAVSYTVKVTDANGCSATSTATTVKVNSLPSATITAGGATSFCQGSSVTLTSNSATSYLWSNTATTQSITVTNGGNYTVKVTDANGCSSTSSATTVIVNSLPNTPTVTQNGNTLMSSATAGNQWYLNGNIIGGATSQSYTPTQNGSYTVTVKDVNSCTATSVAVNVTNVGIEETALQNKFQIYPNPVTNKLNIALRLRSGDNAMHKFEILNVLGQSIYSAMLNEKNVVDMSSFPSGMYVVRIFSDESAPMVKRFVKE